LVCFEIESKGGLQQQRSEDFICREEKMKAAWGHAAGHGNLWSHWSGWKLDFYSCFLVLPESGDVFQVQTGIFWEGEVSPWPIITFWDLMHSALQ
jgi:hypothetical protein